MIATYVEPQNPAMDDIFTPPLGDELVLCKDGLGQVYWPDLFIDEIGDWDGHNGYQCYMNSGGLLAINKWYTRLS